MRNKRKYSLFEKVGNKWERRSEAAYTKETAIRVFQSQLVNGYFAGKRLELRPVKETDIPLWVFAAGSSNGL